MPHFEATETSGEVEKYVIYIWDTKNSFFSVIRKYFSFYPKIQTKCKNKNGIIPESQNPFFQWVQQ